MRRIAVALPVALALLAVACDPTPLYQQSLFRDWPRTEPESLTVPVWDVVPGCRTRECIPGLDAEGAVSLTGPSSGVARFQPASHVPYAISLPVAVVETDGEVRAYPLHVLTRHEIVNDVVGDVPVAVTYCPLCNTALSFDRRHDGDVLDFGVTGYLRHSDLVMFDRQTESWWQQATGEAVAGERAGDRLTPIATRVITYGDFLRTYPDALVMTEDTGLDVDYTRNPYVRYDDREKQPFAFDGEPDPRRDALERVVGIEHAADALAVPFDELAQVGTANVAISGRPFAVFWTPGLRSNLDDSDVNDGRSIGAAVAFDATIDGQRLTFEATGEHHFRDTSTGSTWSITGVAVDGPLAGRRLRPVPHAVYFWFAWAAFNPNTEVWLQR